MLDRTIERKLIGRAALLAVLIGLSASGALAGKKDWVDSPLTTEQQQTLDKAAHSLKSGKPDRAAPFITQALQSANDIPKCLAIAAYTERYGSPMNSVRRQCLERALTLCNTKEDYLQVTLKARQYECYDIARSAINALTGTANSPESLYDLARKAQELGANDVVHISLDKALSLCKTYPQALEFAKQSKLMGAEDLTRKCIKDMIDDESDTHNLMSLMTAIMPYEFKDLERYLLTKSLGVSSTFDQYVEIANMAQRHGDADIRQIAIYRAKKKRIIQQISDDKAKYAQQVQAWKDGQAAQAAQQAQQTQTSTGTAADNTPKSGF